LINYIIILKLIVLIYIEIRLEKSSDVFTKF